MLKKVFWFSVGISVGVFVVVKGRQYLRKLTPDAVTERVTQSVSARAAGVSERISTFVDDARAAMAERESELRDTLGLSEALDPDPSGPRRAAD